MPVLKALFEILNVFCNSVFSIKIEPRRNDGGGGEAWRWKDDHRKDGARIWGEWDTPVWLGCRLRWPCGCTDPPRTHCIPTGLTPVCGNKGMGGAKPLRSLNVRNGFWPPALYGINNPSIHGQGPRLLSSTLSLRRRSLIGSVLVPASVITSDQTIRL